MSFEEEFQLKKVLTLGITVLAGLALTACGNSNNNSNKKRSSTASSLANKRLGSSRLESKKKASSESKADSESKKKVSESSSKAASISVAKASSTSVAQANSASQKASSSSVAASSSVDQESSTSENSSSISMDEHTLTGFLNKYGVSPVLYKTQHGMSEKDAYESTPDSMKTFGERQTQYQKYGIKDVPD